MYSSEYLIKAAHDMGAKVIVDPEWHSFVLIEFANGGRFIFKGGTLSINTSSSARAAGDKDSAAFFLKQSGYPTVPDSRLFFTPTFARNWNIQGRGIDDAYNYAKQLGWPVIVKPNNGSQGSGVYLVHNKQQFYDAMHELMSKRSRVLVQRPFLGKDHRLLVLADTCVAAYYRIPLSIEGDGQSTIQELLQQKRQALLEVGRKVHLEVDDPRILNKLLKDGLNYQHVPTLGQQIFLLDNANLSTGGDAVDVTETIHPKYKELAVNITRDMGLRLCGVDLLIQGDITQPPTDGEWCVLEINASPGVSHFIQIGPRQSEMVQQMYRQALKVIEASFDCG